MSIQAQRERLSALNKEAKHLLNEKGDTTWTKDDQAKFDTLMDEAQRLESQIAAMQKLADDDAEKSFNDIDNFRRSGQQQGQMSDAQKGLDIFLRKPSRDMSAEEAQIFRNTMSTTTGSEGGFTVQPEIAKQLINIMKAFSFMRPEANQLTTSMGNDLSFPTTDGTTEVGEWVAQNTQTNSADVSFGTRPLNVFKASSKVIAVPIELMQDSQIDVQALVLNRLGERIGRVGNLGFTTGSGSGQPNGLVTASSVGVTGATGQTTNIIYDNLVDLVDSLDVAYLGAGANPCWMFAQAMRRVVRKIKDTTGRPIWTPGYEAGATAATPDVLLGYKVCLNNDMPAPAANAKSIAFGDMRKYTIRDAMQVTLFRFDDSAYVTKGQYGFMAWARMGGNLMDTAAVRLYQHSAT